MEEDVKTEDMLAEEVRRLRARLTRQEEALHTAERRLREYEERFDRLLQLVPDAVVITDADDRIRYVNQEAVRLAGADDPADLLGRSLFDFIEPEDVPPARKGGARLRRGTEAPASGQLRIMQLGGRAVLVEAAAVPIHYQGQTGLLGTAHDLTGRQHMERALSETQDLFYHVFRIVPAALVISRFRDGALLDVNEEFLRLTGYEREDVIGASFQELEILADSRFEGLLAPLDEKGVLPEVEVELRHRSGAVRTAVASTRRIQARGESCLLAVFLDVTERKQAAAAEQETRDLFRKVFEASPAAITISRMIDGEVIEANAAAQRMFGFTRDELIGRKLAEDWLHPARRQALIHRLEAGESAENEEIEVYAHEGQVKAYQGSFQPIYVGDELCILSVLLDMTEQKHAEAALRERDVILRSFYDTVSHMMGVVEVHGNDLLHVSDSVSSARLYDTTPERMHRRFARELGADEAVLRRWIDAFRASKRQAEPVQLEDRYPTPEGDRWLSVTVAHLQTLPSDVDRYSYVVNDITDRKEVEQQLVEAKERADALARLRSAILNNITHEVRTPLTVIVGFTSMLRKGVKDGYQRFVDLIERSGNRLMLMLDTILDLAQLEAGTLDVTPEPVDVVEVVERAVSTIRPQAAEKDLTLEVTSTQGRVHACLDHRILNRVLLNLLDNAIKFTDEGRIDVSAEANDASVYVHIRDTGVGIDELYLSHLFEEFSQESTGLERTHQGSGLGLAVSLRLVELIGGNITVESHKGRGSRFTVALPRYHEAVPADDAPQG